MTIVVEGWHVMLILFFVVWMFRAYVMDESARRQTECDDEVKAEERKKANRQWMLTHDDDFDEV